MLYFMGTDAEPVKVTPLSSDDGASSDQESASQLPPLNMPKPHSGSETDSDSNSNSDSYSSEKAAPMGAKRPAEDRTAVAAKVCKRSKKSTHCQRFWSEEDEIVILQGMLDYTLMNKVNPVADLGAFLAVIKEKLHVDFSRVQLKDKIWRLKKKYKNNREKAKEGEERTFLKAHDQEIYDLSKLIWGNDKEDVGVAKVGIDVGKNGKDGVCVVGRNAEERMMMAGKALAGTREWEKLKEVEMQIFLNTLNMQISRTKLVLEHMKSTNQNHGRGEGN